jgi:topoisomerase IV subunit A
VREPNEPKEKNDKRVELLRGINEDDVVRLTEIKIKRISKYNTFEADEYMKRLLEELEQVKHHLAHLTEYAIAYFENLLKKYGKGRERRTEIKVFDTIQATEVVANNAKLYVNIKEGFVGTGLKKGDGVDFVSDCSDIDDIIIFRKDGIFQVVKVADKVFAGKDIIHIAVWRKGDERTTYNLIYLDGKSGTSYAKRFNVTAITRATEYDLTQGNKNSKVLYFTANPNGESEVVTIQLTQNSTAKIKKFEYDFGELAIKGRASQGNIATKYPIHTIKQASVGKSTLGAKRWWFDEITGKLNDNERGRYLGDFDTGDNILILYKDGSYEVSEVDPVKHLVPIDILYLGKLTPETVISAVHFDGNKEWTMVKRFKIETTKLNERYSFLTDHKKSMLLYGTVKPNPRIQYSMKIGSKKMDGEVSIADFIDVKGWKALGNKLSDQKLTGVKDITKEEELANIDTPPSVENEQSETEENHLKENGKLKAGDTIEFDFN